VAQLGSAGALGAPLTASQLQLSQGLITQTSSSELSASYPKQATANGGNGGVQARKGLVDSLQQVTHAPLEDCRTRP
jgi:hypothetical protein